MLENLINILILSTLAGLATGLGGLIAVIKKPGKRLFGFLVGIALHNIPEGIMVALTFFRGGIGRLSCFKAALASGLVEPIGAVVAALLLSIFQALIPIALAFAAGVMVFITLDELIPIAHKYGHEHFTSLGIIVGIIFILLLLGVFKI